MTPPAANALLKTLEEPPPGRVIVLIATRPGALPPTVRSRCQQVSFGSLPDDEVAEVLRRNGWPALSARQAAALAEGSPGTALARDGRLWQETAASVRALLDALAAGDRGAALAFAEAAGDVRERALASLQAIIGYSRLAARQRLGDRSVGPDAVPALLGRMGARADRQVAGGRFGDPSTARGGPPSEREARTRHAAGGCDRRRGSAMILTTSGGAHGARRRTGDARMIEIVKIRLREGGKIQDYDTNQQELKSAPGSSSRRRTG